MREGPRGDVPFKEQTFLQQLYQKLMAVHVTAQQTGKNLNPAETEVWRQIRQVIASGDIQGGNGVTKSGKED